MKVAIALQDGFTDAGLSIALDVLRAANSLCRLAKRREPFEILVCAPTRRGVLTASSLRLSGTATYEDIESADALLVPGTWMESERELMSWLESKPFFRMVDIVRATRARGAMVLSSCSGTFAVGQSGILDGLSATTTWWLAPFFQRAFPKVALDASKAIVAHRHVVTAGAVFAQADVCLHLVRQKAGPEIARRVTRYLLLDEHSGQAPYMAIEQLLSDDPLLRAAEKRIRNHPGVLSVPDLAREIGASERTLARRVRSALSTSPGRWIRRVRAESAAQMLETTKLGVEEVADRAGFGSAAALRRELRDLVGRTPRALRRP